MQRNSSLTRWLLAAALAGVVGVGLGGANALADGPAQAQEATPKLPDAASVTKDMKAIPGLITLFQSDPNNIKQDPSRLLALIPRGLMKQDLLLAISGSKGAQAGFQGDSYLVRFEMSGRKVMLAVPDVRYIHNPKSPVTDAVIRTYTSGYLGAMPVVALGPGGDPLVDLSGILMSGLGMPTGQPPRRDVSEYSKLKSFPDNVLIDCDMAVGSRGGSWDTVGVTFSLRRLPDPNAFSPRVADERVGYFTTTRVDWNAKLTRPELAVRYINHWDLKKKDPSLDLSPPDKPIVFIVEKTVPLQWRKYIAEGALEWNKAFEKLGITGAIIVQQQTDDNEYANVDPEDARYNFIRWIVTGRAFAMGPSRADPRTGQILDADIVFDDSMLRAYNEQIDQLPKIPTALGPDVATFLLKNPQFLPLGATVEDAQKAAEAESGEMLFNAPEGERVMPNVHRQFVGCDCAQGMQRQLGFLQMLYAAQNPASPKIPDRLLGEVIKEVITHEVGHCLGLRHNFKASAWLSVDEIRKRRDNTDDPTCASVMDYMPLLMFKGDDLTKLRHITTPCIGPYDEWAIQYGYKQPTPADGNEQKMLAKLASEDTRPEYAYLTDEDTMGLTSPDPLANRFDMSSDVIAWSKTRVDLADNMLKDIRKTVKEDEPSYYLLRAFQMALREKYRDSEFIGRFVGGLYFNRNRATDPDAKPPLTPVEGKLQRSAIAALGKTVFQDDFLLPDPGLYNSLVPTRWGDGSYAQVMSARIDYPVHQTIANIQGQVLMMLVNPVTLQRVYDAELKTPAGDKFTAAELLTSVRDLVWTMPKDGQKFTDSHPALSSVRRNLQRQHLKYLLALVDTDSGLSPDLQSMARQAAQDLSAQIGHALQKYDSKLDFATRAHLNECKSRIDRVLNALYTKGQGGGAGRVIILGQPAGN